MAGSSASGRKPPPDGRATGKSGLGPLEALWKHAAEKRCAILTGRAKPGRFAGTGKCRKLRKNSRFRAIVHGSFDTTHNLKAAGSNPAPATTDNDKPVASAAGFVVFAAFPMACRSVQLRIVPSSPCSVA